MKNDELCIQNDEFCIQNEKIAALVGLPPENAESLQVMNIRFKFMILSLQVIKCRITNDEFCICIEKGRILSRSSGTRGISATTSTVMPVRDFDPIFNAQFMICNAKIIMLNAEFIIFMQKSVAIFGCGHSARPFYCNSALACVISTHTSRDLPDDPSNQRGRNACKVNFCIKE